MEQRDVIKANNEAIKQGVRDAFNFKVTAKVRTYSVGQATQSVPEYELHRVNGVIITLPYQQWDELKQDEAVDPEAIKRRKTVGASCSITNFNGASKEITFPVTVFRGNTEREQKFQDESMDRSFAAVKRLAKALNRR